MRHTIHEMELTEGIFRAGDNYFVDEIQKDGAEMLVTKDVQSDRCDWARYRFEEQLLNNYAMDGYGEHYQTKARVRF